MATTNSLAGIKGFVPRPLVERFWERIDRTGECWIWLGAKTKKGYGQIWSGGKSEYAHRVSFEMHKGAIQPADKRITVNAESLADAIKAAAITNETINISFNGESGRLSGVSRNQDETDIGFDATGDEVSMSLNAKYLIDALSFYSGETVLGFNDTQLVIDGDYRNVVMCVRS